MLTPGLSRVAFLFPVLQNLFNVAQDIIKSMTMQHVVIFIEHLQNAFGLKELIDLIAWNLMFVRVFLDAKEFE
jgi:hypothetical protein